MTKRIFVIDDEEDVLALVRATLVAKGWDVETFTDGAEAIAAAEKQRPHLIITDLMMPRISGLEVLKRLKRHPTLHSVPLFVLSALGEDEKRPRDFWINTLGIDDYLAKPFDPFDLMGRVEYVFRRDGYKSSTESSSGSGMKDVLASAPSEEELKEAPPSVVVREFVESSNRNDFTTEYRCLAEEMRGGATLDEYTSARKGAAGGHGHRQRVVSIEEEKISAAMARVVINREDTDDGAKTARREQYSLRKTMAGWKIIRCQLAK